MDKRYTAMATPPQNATKTIVGGKLKGFSDINPQWRYEALTEQFGLCGLGWKFEITKDIQVPVPATGEVMVYVFVNLFLKDGDEWSDAIPGVGGDFLIEKDKNGIHGNDEAYKMAVTDALGNAAKTIGVAADVYRGTYNTKYNRSAQSAQRPTPNTTERDTAKREKYKAALIEKAGAMGIDRDALEVMIEWRYKFKLDEINTEQIVDFGQHFEEYVKAFNHAEDMQAGVA